MRLENGRLIIATSDAFAGRSTIVIIAITCDIYLSCVLLLIVGMEAAEHSETRPASACFGPMNCTNAKNDSRLPSQPQLLPSAVFLHYGLTIRVRSTVRTAITIDIAQLGALSRKACKPWATFALCHLRLL